MPHTLEAEKLSFTKMLLSAALAAVIFFGGAAAFVKIITLTRGPAADVPAKAVAEKPAPTLPDDIPMYKSGSVASAKAINNAHVFEVYFSLGALEEIQAYYTREMSAAGWKYYAKGGDQYLYQKDEGKRKATLYFDYYAGKATVKITLNNPPK